MQRSHEVLDYVGLGEVRYRKVESYSSGMKQRLKLAAAIVHDPKLLIMDEPTNGMDPAGREEMLHLAFDLAHHKNMSVLFSSHLLPDVEAVCDHIIVLGAGKLMLQGDIQTLKVTHNRCFEVRLKTGTDTFSSKITNLGCVVRQRGDMLLVEIPEGSSPAMLWQTATTEQYQIRHLRPQRSTLEEVFMKACGRG